MIKDSTKEQLSGAVQNNAHKLFTLPKVVKRCKKESITDGMKNLKAYQKLRQERINKRYAGVRAKRAKEAEDAKK
jgi:large subunit ribosomal protein L13e